MASLLFFFFKHNNWHFPRLLTAQAGKGDGVRSARASWCLSSRKWEILRPLRRRVFLDRTSWLTAVQEELRGLGEALEMGQNRTMHTLYLICGRKWSNWCVLVFMNPPLSRLSRKESFSSEKWWQKPFSSLSCFFLESISNAETWLDTLLCPLKFDIFLVLSTQCAASTCPQSHSRL